MATIIQKPDTLSLLGNLKSFIINSSSEISFELYRGTDIIISETYYPNGLNQIEIDIRDVIRSYVPTPTPNLSQATLNTPTYTFSANVDGTTTGTFRVIPAGVRKLTDTAANFLRDNWLTWQPQTKAVGYYDPEFLSYFFNSTGKVMVKFYLLNGQTDIREKETITGGLYTLKMSMDHLITWGGHNPSELQGYIDVWVADSSGTRLSYIQRYIYQPSEADEHYYLCVNSLGGIDTFSFHGALSLIPEVEHQIAGQSDVMKNITESAVRKWSQNTGYLNKSQGIWLWELLSARSHWTLSDGVLEAIVLDTSDMTVNDKENLHSCSFKFSLAEEGRLLNINRNAGALPSLTVPTPGNLFFLDERLADYGDAILDDSLLFAVQYPSSDQWYKTSLGAISQWIIGLITDSEVGRPIHGHANKAVLDKFSEESGKPAYDNKPLATTEETEAKFLRKDREDSASEHVTLEKGVTFGESFAEGPTGHGGKVDAQGNAELHSLRIRTWMEVNEFRNNRISIIAGNDWRAPGGGLIETVEIDTDAIGQQLLSGTITLKLEEGEIGMVAVDDICMGIFHNEVNTSENSSTSSDDSRGNFQFAGFSTVYFRVTEILDARNSVFRYQLRGTGDTWQFINHPHEQMTFVGYGNFTDPTRQTSRYSTRTYERYLKDVSTWEFSKNNIAAQFGDLSNLSVFGLNMTGYSAYLNNIYMSGTIQQFEDLSIRLEINTDGDPFIAFGETKHISCVVWKGFEDVTDQVTSWSIVRDSGDPLEDAAWLLKDKVKNFSGEMDISFTSEESDIAENEYTVSTLFTITAVIENESVVNILTI